jgi:hypothetical protein
MSRGPEKKVLSIMFHDSPLSKSSSQQAGQHNGLHSKQEILL